MKRIKIISLYCAVVLVATGCGQHQSSGQQSQSGATSGQTETQKSAGDIFLTSNLKIQSKIVDNSVSPARDITVELYVDSNGNGEGMLGFGETVCKVKVVRDVLYILLDEDTVVNVSDLSGRCVMQETELVGLDDLASYGFSVVSGNPVSYSARSGQLTINTVFARSTQVFEAASLSTENVKTFKEAIDYAIDFYTAKAVEVETGDKSEELTSFYLDSPYGITIDGDVYSVGDTCNPSTYFGNRTPEGLLTSWDYKEDVRVDYLHASYLSDTGRTTFTLTSNYVQAIETNTAFNWLGIEYGTSAKDLKYILGYRLSKKELETWKPINKDLVVTAFAHNIYYCSIGTLEAELRVDSKLGLSSIYLSRPLEYRSAS